MRRCDAVDQLFDVGPRIWLQNQWKPPICLSVRCEGSMNSIPKSHLEDGDCWNEGLCKLDIPAIEKE